VRKCGGGCGYVDGSGQENGGRDMGTVTYLKRKLVSYLGRLLSSRVIGGIREAI